MKFLISACLLTSMTIFSCTSEQNISPSQNLQKAGRFDEKPFQWDYESLSRKNEIFIGNILSSRGSFFLSNNSTIYSGAVFPKSSIDNFTFDQEYNYEKTPYSLYFMYGAKSYISSNIIEKNTHEKYLLSKNEAVTSLDFTNYIRNIEKLPVNFKSVEVQTYSDIEKYLGAKDGFGKVFTNEMTLNKQNLNYKSMYFAQLENTTFNVLFNNSNLNFFKEQNINDQLSDLGKGAAFNMGEPVFVRNVVFGSFAFLAIESEYSYSEVKNAVENMFNLWKINPELLYDANTEKILGKSSVTIYLNVKTTDNQNVWAVSLDSLKSMFLAKYNENYLGSPMYIEVRDVKNDKIYLPQKVR